MARNYVKYEARKNSVLLLSKTEINLWYIDSCFPLTFCMLELLKA